MTTDAIDLRGQVAVVTGATRGIGREVALQLARDGVTVVVVGRTGTGSGLDTLPGSVDDTVSEIAALGGQALGIAGNLADEGETQEIIDRTLDELGRCDIFVHNAAYTSNGPMLEIPWKRWDRAFRVQIVAPHQMCQAFVPGMRERGEGRIITVSTGAALSVTPSLGLYSSSKRAMEHWAAYLHAELRHDGIDTIAVNTVRVDRLVATEGWRHMAATKGIELATGGSPDAIPATTESVAASVVWAAHRPVSWSGNALGLTEIEQLGGPAQVDYDVTGAELARNAP